MKVLTEQDDDAEQNSDNGARAESCTHNSIYIRTVPVGVTLANLHTKDGNV